MTPTGLVHAQVDDVDAIDCRDLVANLFRPPGAVRADLMPTHAP